MHIFKQFGTSAVMVSISPDEIINFINKSYEIYLPIVPTIPTKSEIWKSRCESNRLFQKIYSRIIANVI